MGRPFLEAAGVRNGRVLDVGTGVRVFLRRNWGETMVWVSRCQPRLEWVSAYQCKYRHDTQGGTRSRRPACRVVRAYLVRVPYVMGARGLNRGADDEEDPPRQHERPVRQGRAVPEEWSRYGGRALTDAIVFDEVPPKADPLGPDNKLVFAPGMLGGTTAPNGGRLSVGAKSPLTGGIKESNSGGQAAHALAQDRASPRSSSRASRPTRPRATCSTSRPTARPSSSASTSWAGLGNYELADEIKAMTRREDDRYATITIGPAGESG